jgi:hypothetical protein
MSHGEKVPNPIFGKRDNVEAVKGRPSAAWSWKALEGLLTNLKFQGDKCFQGLGHLLTSSRLPVALGEGRWYRMFS